MAPSSHHAVVFPARAFVCAVSSVWYVLPLLGLASPHSSLEGPTPEPSFPLSQAEGLAPSLAAHSLHTAEVLRQNNWDPGLDGSPISRSCPLNEMLLLLEPHFAPSEKWGQEPSSCSVLFHTLCDPHW